MNCLQPISAGTSRSAVGLPRRRAAAFSLIEIMIVMALLSVMVLGLMAMFNQTQRAFRLGMAQTDVLESGRVASDLLGRELQEIVPTSSNTNFNFSPSFYAELMNLRNTSVQPLNGTGPVQARANMLEDIFFVTHENQTWSGIGYFVRSNIAFPTGAGFNFVGALYRFETNDSAARFQQNPGGLVDGFAAAVDGRARLVVSKIVDGVVHFRVRAFDTNGILISPLWVPTNGLITVREQFAALPGENTLYVFKSNAVPASLELELGILEPQVFERMKSLPTPQAQSNFLASQAAHVHLFRQRVSIRNVDPSGYQ